MNKKGGLFTHAKEQITWIYRIIFLVIFSLIILLVISKIMVFEINTEDAKLEYAIVNAQKCLEKNSFYDFSVINFKNCFDLDKFGIKISSGEKMLFENEEFAFNRDFCDFNYACSGGHYFLERNLVKIEVLIKNG
ncbi:MAG: hypothetical protein ABIB47_05845 [Candidatus Woesearchaeota archaeon]